LKALHCGRNRNTGGSMTTDLKKPVKRRSYEMCRDRSGKLRALIVTIYPTGFIGLRLEGTRREEEITIMQAYDRAIMMRLELESAEKASRRKEKRDGRA
jgi:hypothetical protein